MVCSDPVLLGNFYFTMQYCGFTIPSSFAVFRHFEVISMRFAAFLCYSVQCLYVFLYGFAVFVPPPRLMLPPPPPQVAMDVCNRSV